MEEFDLRKYESGEYDVVTRSGYPAKIIYTKNLGKYPIVALIRSSSEEETAICVNMKGHFSSTFNEHYNDIFLIKRKWRPKEGELFYYVSFEGIIFSCVYFDKNDKEKVNYGNCFRTREEAEEMEKKIKELFNNN